MKSIISANLKAQMKIQEMIFMILGLAFLLILLFLFYIAFSTGNIRNLAESKLRDSAVTLASGLAGSPELSCPEGLGIGSFVCIDADKAAAMANRQEYSKFWDVNSIRIEKVYPISEKKIICSMNNYPDCNIFIIVSNKTAVKEDYSTFVSLCRKESINEEFYNKCELGRILITPKTIK